MSPGSDTESYPAFAHIGLRENLGKNLNQVTRPDRESNSGHLGSWLDALTVTPQVWTIDIDQLKLTLVQTLVMPHFDYCDILLSDLSSELSVKLQRVQNMCVRYVCNIRRYDHISPSFSDKKIFLLNIRPYFKPYSRIHWYCRPFAYVAFRFSPPASIRFSHPIRTPNCKILVPPLLSIDPLDEVLGHHERRLRFLCKTVRKPCFLDASFHDLETSTDPLILRHSTTSYRNI
ncbi:hypothetical protein ANN_15916 [Periplaneta americana]|uniref:Uncharacterized protein n=1 Tax=Periplaneta americana TaxID=6978 RepID=A0ABQ8SIF0_PERAM|nr:hypothetical protein ANN_15916 [Periplaneta americana]